VQLVRFAFQISVAEGASPGSLIRSMYLVVRCNVHAVVVVDDFGPGPSVPFVWWDVGLAEQPAAKSTMTTVLAVLTTRLARIGAKVMSLSTPP
jgi:hypothetical protein